MKRILILFFLIIFTFFSAEIYAYALDEENVLPPIIAENYEDDDGGIIPIGDDFIKQEENKKMIITFVCGGIGILILLGVFTFTKNSKNSNKNAKEF